MSDEQNKSLTQRFRGLAAFLAEFEQPDFRFGEWSEPESTEPGVMTMPYYSLSPVAGKFVESAYEFGWVLRDFDWPAWKDTPEAVRLRDNRSALESASPDDLARLLTVLILQERFCEGALASAFESGLLTRIVRRAAVLAASESRDSTS